MRIGTCLVVTLLCGVPWLDAGQSSSFDKLSAADRVVFAERFQRELWPLLTRGGKDSCLGCHHGKHSSGLRLSGQADADFRTLLREGFLLKDDPGSVLASVTRTDGKRRMPPGKRPAWSAAEVRLLRDFVEDLHKRQQP